jgi:hypothetical protein
MTNTRGYFIDEMTEREYKVRQELNDQEDSLRRVLRDAVVNDVTKLFP